MPITECAWVERPRFLGRFFVPFLSGHTFRRGIPEIYGTVYFHEGNIVRLQAAGLSASSPRSCGLYSPIPNVFSGLTPFPIVFHRSFLLSASSILVEMSPPERLCFLTAKVYGNSGNERVPASVLCPVKNNAVVRPPQHFFRPKLF